MVANKHITKIIAVIVAILVLLCLLAVLFSDEISSIFQSGKITMEYESALFNTDSVISVNIIMDEADWNEMLQNATSEEYYQCDVEINGTTFYQVAIRPKGNTSLSTIAADPTTNRYSFKLEFDHYVEGQTCFGLDKLILNNNYADATNMKETLIYDMFNYLGADASLYNYAKISVNGEYWGVYLALEAVEDSFMLRNYGAESGELYKPESMEIGGGNFNQEDFPAGLENFSLDEIEGMDFSNFENFQNYDSFEGFNPSENGASEEEDSTGDSEKTQQNFQSMPNLSLNFGKEMNITNFFSSDGANLNYIDDELDSYSTIWEGEITSTSDADHKRVVTALKNISQGNNLEDYMDIDNLLRYMAVHVFSVNEDSLSGTMAHNYYLYESDGKLNLIPWDYNLSLGGMGGGSDATSVVNSAIDDAFSSTEFFDTLMENETYHSEYYALLEKLAKYINGTEFDSFYKRVRSQIDELVKEDPTAFYSYEEYEQAAETLYEVVKLRGESIKGQLEGTIASTNEEQKACDTLIDASNIDLSVMGSMNTGDENANGAADSFSQNPNQSFDFDDFTQGDFFQFQTPPDMPEGSEDAGQSPPDESIEKPNDAEGENSQAPLNSPGGSNETDKNSQNNNLTKPPSMDTTSEGTSTVKTQISGLAAYAISIVVLILAFAFALRYKRNGR